MSDDRDEDPRLLMVSAFLLGTQPGTLGGMVRQAGTETEVKLSPNARHYTAAAVMLAKHLIETVDATAADDLSDGARDYLRLLVDLGSLSGKSPAFSRERRELVNKALASFDADLAIVPTDRGRALVGEPEKVVTQPEESE